MWEAFYLEDPCELTFANTLLLSNAAISLGNAFINLEISSEYIIFFTLWSFFLSSLFISLQIKEFRILALSINDSLYSSLFFFLTGLHFFHLSIGLILLIYFWSSVSTVTTPHLRSFPLVVGHLLLPSSRLTPFGFPPEMSEKDREARWPLSFSSGVYRVVHRQALHFPGTLLLAWRLSPKSRKERGMLDLP